MTTLQKMLDAQDAFQASLPSGALQGLALDKTDIPTAVQALFINTYAAEDELHELLAETSWKPWAKGDRLDLEAARGEFIDVWHFVLNIANILGLDEDAIAERYAKKRGVNIARQEAGYDGVSTKCPGCKRALDDDAVTCHTVKDYSLGGRRVNGVICDYLGRFFTDTKPEVTE